MTRWWLCPECVAREIKELWNHAHPYYRVCTQRWYCVRGQTANYSCHVHVGETL